MGSTRAGWFQLIHWELNLCALLYLVRALDVHSKLLGAIFKSKIRLKTACACWNPLVDIAGPQQLNTNQVAGWEAGRQLPPETFSKVCNCTHTWEWSQCMESCSTHLGRFVNACKLERARARASALWYSSYLHAAYGWCWTGAIVCVWNCLCPSQSSVPFDLQCFELKHESLHWWGHALSDSSFPGVFDIIRRFFQSGLS